VKGVSIVGVGLSRFGRQPGVSARAMAIRAVHAALEDAGIAWSDVQVAFGGSDGSGLADTLVSDLGLTGIPFTNVKNGCATGGSALLAACHAVLAGAADVALALGFDKHPPGAFDPVPEDWGLPSGVGSAGLMLTTQFFALKLRRYMHDYGISAEALALVAAKAYRNGSLNENAWRREQMSSEQILTSGLVNDPLTRFMFCSPGEGAGAVVITRDALAHRFGGGAVQVRAATMRSRPLNSFEVFSPWLVDGELTSVSRVAARAAFEMAGIGPEEVDVAQLQDTESGAEIMHMAECGFCEDGDQEKLLQEHATDLDGRMPVNTDGGCIANGEPIGASGLRQIAETVTQLRGRGGRRQVAGSPTVGFTHVYGAPGVSLCTVLTV
jgi:acetyl-CoA acyltransferase